MSVFTRPAQKQDFQRRDRWTNWARRIAERHQQVAMRPGGPAMRLAQAPAPLYWHSRRWEQAAWTFAPLIHLAISPLLRAKEATGAPLPGPRPAQTIFLQPAPSPAERPVKESAWVNYQRIEQRPSAPLDLLLRRVEQSDTAAHLNRTLVANESVRVVRRLIESSQRVEVRPPRAMMTPWPNQTALTTEASTAFASPRPRPRNARMAEGDNGGLSTRGDRMDKEGSWPRPLPPPLDLNQLTDQVMRQIDHRLVAYRERLGKGA